MILADLHHHTLKYLLNTVFGIKDNRLNVKASSFKIMPGFFINRLVFSGDLFPVQVLF
jgi:hypothetical protein